LNHPLSTATEGGWQLPVLFNVPILLTGRDSFKPISWQNTLVNIRVYEVDLLLKFEIETCYQTESHSTALKSFSAFSSGPGLRGINRALYLSGIDTRLVGSELPLTG
jgi:hypothetical protein